MKLEYFWIVSSVAIIVVIAISGCVKEITPKHDQSLSNQIKYDSALCNELANRLDNVARNLSEGEEIIGGVLKTKEFSNRYFGGMIGVEKFVFGGTNMQLEINRIDDGQGPFQVGAFYRFNLSSMKLYDPLSGAYGSPAGFSDKELNKLEEIDCK